MKRSVIEEIRGVFREYGISIDPARIPESLLSAIWKLCRDATLRRQSERKCEEIRKSWLDDMRILDEYRGILSDNLLLPGQQEWIADAASTCSCCTACSDHPCAGTLAGGVCDRAMCRCSEDVDVPF